MIQEGIVNKNNNVWQGHPDVAIFNKNIFVVYRQSNCHLATKETKIKLTKHSLNQNNDYNEWKEPIIIEDNQIFNCPRLSVINNTLYIICDVIPDEKNFIDAEKGPNTRIWIWKSLDGINWEDPIKTNIQGIVPDRICKTDNAYLIATHTFSVFAQNTLDIQMPQYGRLIQNVWRAETIDDIWNGPITIAKSIKYNFCEASICHYDNYLIAIMRENSRRGEPAYKCVSNDNGFTWSRPKATRLFGCHRPVTDELRSGNYLTTYREQIYSVRQPYWSKNTIACLTNRESMMDISSPMIHSINLSLDHDNSKISDGGYTGWVQLPNNSIFIVNYITKEEITPHIKWYIIKEEDF